MTCGRAPTGVQQSGDDSALVGKRDVGGLVHALALHRKWWVWRVPCGGWSKPLPSSWGSCITRVPEASKVCVMWPSRDKEGVSRVYTSALLWPFPAGGTRRYVLSLVPRTSIISPLRCNWNWQAHPLSRFLQPAAGPFSPGGEPFSGLLVAHIVLSFHEALTILSLPRVGHLFAKTFRPKSVRIRKTANDRADARVST